MTDIGEIPQLVIVPVDNLILHEYHDEQRTPALVRRLCASGVLRNPPVVLPLPERGDIYMVLDGANRVSAFKKAGIPHILVQVTQAGDPHLDLNSWNHVLWGIPADELYNRIKKIPGIMLQPSTPALSFRDLMDIHALVSLHLPNGRVFTAFTPAVDLLSRVAALNQVVSKYIAFARVDRTTAYQINQLQYRYNELSGLVMPPQFQVTDLLYVVASGQLMPPGITRFTISPRILNINYSLEALISDEPVERKNLALQQWIAAKLAEKRVRYYAEPTISFDE